MALRHHRELRHHRSARGFSWRQRFHAGPSTSRWPARYIHDNTYKSNGTDPQGTYASSPSASDGRKRPSLQRALGRHPRPGWVWRRRYGRRTDRTRTSAWQDEQAAFVNFHGDKSLLDPKGWTTDTGAHQCMLPALPSLTP